MTTTWLGLSVVFGGVLGLLGSCATQSLPASPTFPPQTTLTLAAGRCEAGRCACRALDEMPGKERGIPAGSKRFELRIPRSTAALWVKVGDRGVYYKPPKTVLPQCLYVDLESGRHDIVVYGERRDPEVGLQLGLTIYEYGEPEKGSSWYRSFHMTCGLGASPCSHDEMLTWRDFQHKLPRGVLDSCGSVMVKGASFSGTRAQKGDDQYVKAVARFSLKVYKFKPYYPSGSPKCKAPSKNH